MSSRHRPRLETVACLLFGLACALPAWASAPTAAGKAVPQGVPAASPGAEGTAGRAKPRIALIALGLDAPSERAAALLFHLGERAADGTGRFERIDLADFLDPDALAEAQPALERVRALLGEAKAAYDELELGLARDKAGQAEELAQKADLSKHFALYVEAQMLRIAALLADSEIQEAERRLDRLLPMDLHTPFDPDLYSPDYVAQVKEARASLGKASAKGLDLKVQPVSAQVYVDGQFRGISPIEMHDLVPGEHVVTLIAPGYRRVQRTITPGTASSLTEALEPTPLGARFQPLLQDLRGKFLDRDRGRAAQALAQFLGAEQIAVFGVRSAGSAGFRVTGIRMDAGDGHEYAYLDESFPPDEGGFAAASRGFFGGMFSADAPRGKGGQAVQAKVDAFEWKMRHTSYVLFGVAAAALGSGITFGVNAHHQANTYADLDAPQTNPVYDRIETVGRRSAILSDVSFGVALAAAATGTVLLIRDLVKRDSFGGRIDDQVSSLSVGLLPAAASEAPAADADADAEKAPGARPAASPSDGDGERPDDDWGDGW